MLKGTRPEQGNKTLYNELITKRKSSLTALKGGVIVEKCKGHKGKGKTMDNFTEWLQAELQTAEEAWNDAVLDSGHASPRAKYWAGYMEAITNALHNYNGQGE